MTNVPIVIDILDGSGLAAVAAAKRAQAIADGLDDVVGEIGTARTEALGAIDDARIAAVTEIESLADPAAGAIAMYAQQVKSAVGNGSLKCLFDYQAGTTLYSGGPALLSWASLDNTPLTLTLDATLYSGANPRPILAADGIEMYNQAGFSMASSPLPSLAGDFAMFYPLIMPSVTPYATKALRNAATGVAEGTIAYVNADDLTTVTPNPATVQDQAIPEANLIAGYSVYSQGAWNEATSTFDLFGIGQSRSASSSYFRTFINHLGQAGVEVMSTLLADFSFKSVRSADRKPIALTGTQLLVIRRKGGLLSLFLGGEQVGTIPIGDWVDPAAPFSYLTVNGFGRTAAASHPVDGLRHKVRGLIMVDNLPSRNFKRLHNIIAARHGTPLLRKVRWVDIILKVGQSWFDYLTSVVSSGDSYTLPQWGWKGEITEPNGSYSAMLLSVNRKLYPNQFCGRGKDMSLIAPFHLEMASGASASPKYSFYDAAPAVEGLIPGFNEQVTAHAKYVDQDFVWCNGALSGHTIEDIFAEPITNMSTFPFESLTSTVFDPTENYALLLQQLAYAVKWAQERGLSIRKGGMFGLHGQSGLADTGYKAAWQAGYAKLNAAWKKISGLSSDLVALFMQCNRSQDGVQNSGITNAGHIDQVFLDLETEGQAAGLPIYCIDTMYQRSPYIHGYRRLYAALGEIFGDAWARLTYGGERNIGLNPLSFTPGSGGGQFWMDVKYKMPLGRGLTFITSNDNTIPGIATTAGAVNSYGFEVSGTSLTIPTAPVIMSSTKCVMTGAIANDFRGVPTLTVSAISSGRPAVGQVLSGTGVTATKIVAPIAINLDGTGTYQVDVVQTAASTTITATVADTVRVYTSRLMTTGDIITGTGTRSFYMNLCDGPKIDGIFRDQDWTAPMVSGFPADKPGNLNDKRKYAAAFRYVLP